MQPNPWRDLEDLAAEGWSVAVTGYEENGEPAGIQIDAERRSFLLGHPPTRARVIGKTVAQAAPKLLRQIARVSTVLLV